MALLDEAHYCHAAAAATQPLLRDTPSLAALAARYSLAARWFARGTVAGGVLQRVKNAAVVRLALELAYGVYFDLFVLPLFRFYLSAPRFTSWLGGYAGKPLEDVCSELTPSSARYWATHMDECEALVWRRFEAWLAALEFALWMACLIYAMRCGARLLASSWRSTWRAWRRRHRRRSVATDHSGSMSTPGGMRLGNVGT